MRKSLLTYILVIGGICCLWFFTIYVPYHKDHQEKRKEIAEAEKQLMDFQKTIAELPRFIEKHKSLASMREDLNSKLYTKNDVLKLFEKLRSEASAKNVEVTEITPPIEELLYLNTIIPDSSQPQFLNIGLKLEGNFISFGKYVQEVEGADYFRGINWCRVFAHSDDETKITMFFDFKSLLGSLKEES